MDVCAARFNREGYSKCIGQAHCGGAVRIEELGINEVEGRFAVQLLDEWQYRAGNGCGITCAAYHGNRSEFRTVYLKPAPAFVLQCFQF